MDLPNNEDLKDIILKKMDNLPTTPQEDEIYLQWFTEPLNMELLERLADTEERFQRFLELERASRRVHMNLTEQLQEEFTSVSRSPRRFWRPLPGWAAAAIVIVGTVTFYYLSRPDKEQTKDVTASQIQPGSDKATLTLANGQTIVLDGKSSGHLADQGKASIQQQSGALAYDNILPTEEVVYNELATPRGGKFIVTLGDGSKVMLNSATRVRYPSSFGAKGSAGRSIELLEGEAYLEVTRNEKLPFTVKIPAGSGGSATPLEITVLGTRFNIRNYTSETNIRTTLVEGKVKVTRGEEMFILAPLQQAIAAKTGDGLLEINDNIKADTIIDWTVGRFLFNNSSIENVISKLALWYDLDVKYVDDPAIDASHRRAGATGSFPRSMRLETILNILAETGVKFELRGRTITVYI